MSVEEDCPLCKENGHKRKLRKFSINFEDSIILCSNSKCTYPMGCINLDALLRSPSKQELTTNGGDPSNWNYGLSSEKGVGSNGFSQLKLCQPMPKVKQKEQIVCPQQKGLCPQQNDLCLKQNDVCSQQNDVCLKQNDVCLKQNVVSLQHNGVCSKQNKPCAFTEVIPILETYPNGCSENNILCSKVLDNKPVTCSKDNPTNIPVNKSPFSMAIKSKFSDKSLRFSNQFSSYISNNQAPGASNKLSVSGLQTVFTKTGLCSGKDELVKVDERPVKCPIDRWFLQWENRDALCWLDVVLCLLVQSQSIRKAIEIKETNLTDSKKGFLVRTLLSEYDQALTLSKSLLFECRQRLQSERKHKSILSEQDIVLCSANVGLPQSHKPGHIVKPVSQLYPNKEDKFGQLNVTHNGKLTSILSGKKGVPLKMGAGQTDIPLIPTRTSLAEIIARNADFCKARSILNTVRELTWEELQPKLRCEKGRKDSPVFAIPLLLHSDPDICHLFNTTYKFETRCNQCGNSKIERYTKVLPTLPKVVAEFSMSNICHLRDCFTCKAPNQKRQLHFESLADCVMIHFVEGLPSPDLSLLDFSLDGESFHVSAVVQYKNEPSHFVIWIQHSSGDSWMECDDLKGPLCKFSQSRPCLPASEIHIVFWERDTNTTKQTNQHTDSQTTTTAAVVVKGKDTRSLHPLIDKLTIPVEKNSSREITPTKLITSNIPVENCPPLSSTPVQSYTENKAPMSKIVKTEYKPKSSVMNKNYLLLKQMKAKQSGEKSIHNKATCSTTSVNSPAIEKASTPSPSEMSVNIFKSVNSLANGKIGTFSSSLETAARPNIISVATTNKNRRESVPIKLKSHMLAPKFEAYRSKKDTSVSEERDFIELSASASSMSTPSTATSSQYSLSNQGMPVDLSTLSSSSVEFSSFARLKRRTSSSDGPKIKRFHTTDEFFSSSSNSQGKGKGDNLHSLHTTHLTTVPVGTGADNSGTLRGGHSQIPCNTVIAVPPVVTGVDNYPEFTDIDLTDLGFCNIGTGLVEGELTTLPGSVSGSHVLAETGDSTLCEADILQDLYKALDITAPESTDVDLIEDIFS